jgi:hypothetical protein
MPWPVLLKELVREAVTAAATAVVSAVVDLVRGKPPAQPDPDESHPLTHRDVEHIRAQERASIEASKRAAITTRPPRAKPGKVQR